LLISSQGRTLTGGEILFGLQRPLLRDVSAAHPPEHTLPAVDLNRDTDRGSVSGCSAERFAVDGLTPVLKDSSWSGSLDSRAVQSSTQLDGWVRLAGKAKGCKLPATADNKHVGKQVASRVRMGPAFLAVRFGLRVGRDGSTRPPENATFSSKRETMRPHGAGAGEEYAVLLLCDDIPLARQGQVDKYILHAINRTPRSHWLIVDWAYGCRQ